MSKTALLGLVKVLAPELRARGVRINAVAPGLIQTRFSAAVRAGCRGVLGAGGGYGDGGGSWGGAQNPAVGNAEQWNCV